MGYVLLFILGALSGYFSSRPSMLRTVILGVSLILFAGLLAIVIPMGYITYPIALAVLLGFLVGNLIEYFTH